MSTYAFNELSYEGQLRIEGGVESWGSIIEGALLVVTGAALCATGNGLAGGVSIYSGVMTICDGFGW